MSNGLTTEKSTDAVSSFSRFANLLKALIAFARPKHSVVAPVTNAERLSPKPAAKTEQVVQTASVPKQNAAAAPAAVAALRDPAANAPAASSPAVGAMPTLSIGQIGTRLGFALPSAFLESLGFVPTRHRGAVLFHEEQFPAICEAIAHHVLAVVDEHLALSHGAIA